MVNFLKKWNKYFTFAAFLSMFVNMLHLTFSFYMFAIYRNVVISYSSASLANITTIAFFALIVMGFFIYVRSRLLAKAGENLTLELRQDIYSLMIKGNVMDNQRAYQGGLNDLATLQNYFSSPAVYALFDAPWSPFYMALIFLIHPVLGLVAVVGAMIVVGLSILQEVLIKQSMAEANTLNTKNFRFIDSFMRNVEVINGMGMIKAIQTRFARGNTRVMKNQTQSSMVAAAIQAAIKPMQNLIQVMIYCAGAYHAVKHGFDVGLMVAASIIMGRGLGPLMQVVSSWRMTVQARGAYEKVKAFSQLAVDQDEKISLPPPEGNISVENAVLIKANQILIRGVSFDMAQGEFLGLIGPSGAGKTSLCRLLLGIWSPSGGRVSLDNNDIFAWDKEEIGQHIGYLPQVIELFPGSVGENIARLGKIDAELLETAVALAGIKEMVESFPEGLDTQLEGENGLRLSGGQRQKIGLARALYGNPKLLVLDEPTSNLDEAGESQLLEALNKLKTDKACTCIMVTHKPALLQSMDRIMVLQNGSVAMLGPRDEVFSKLAGAA
ncbi:MAG: type I secretion system permease/ATPase [Proteobacteria bacterium]|nr:type I secretion system permease/ATPase [Desulfobacula sp.]MBU4132602.1 type I secretion system permease/ATPase [Pseudomonadota bacterium]